MTMTRRDIIGSAIATAMVGSSRELAARETQRSPNIVFVLADDMGYADLSCYGRNGPGTPAIDSLAAEGMKFRYAYANSCVCSATRLGLITGRYQYRLRAGLEEPLAGTDHSFGLPAQHPTLPSLLRTVGYETSLVGKWHLGGPPQHGPLLSGYDRFYGIHHGAADYFTHRVASKRSGQKAAPPAGLFEGEVPLDAVGYMTDLLGDRAVSEVERFAAREQPFFMSLHFTAPHWPWEGPEDAQVSRTLIDPRHPDGGGNLETYGRMLRSLDANVGKVLGALAANSLAENTIIVFSSDNGGERFSDVWPLIGRKGELLEGGIRVPLLVRWPGRIAPGSRSDQVTISMDWFPTLLEIAGATPDPRHSPDGRSILPMLTGASPVPRTLFWRFRANNQRAVRDGNWKYLSLGGKEYLFDVSRDEREQANLKDGNPERFAAMKASYEQWNRQMLPYPDSTHSEDVRRIATDRY